MRQYGIGYSKIELICDYLIVSIILSLMFALVEYICSSRVDYIVYVGTLVGLTVVTILFRKQKLYRLERTPTLFFMIVGTFYFIILSLYLYSFPYFPLHFSIDFVTHLQDALDIMGGKYTSTLFPANFAIKFLLSAWLSIGFGNILLFARLFVMFLSWSTIFPVYSLGYRIGGEKIGEIALISYVLISPFWYYVFIETGLYANMLGVIIGLYFIRRFIIMLERNSFVDYILVVLSSFVMFLAHSSNMLVVGASILGFVYLNLFENKKVQFKIVLVPLIGLLLVLAFFPYLIFRLPSALQGPYTEIAFTDRVFEFFKSNSLTFLSYIYAYNRISLVLFVLIVIEFIRLFLKRNLGYYSILFIWFFGAFGLSFFSSNVWRFALLSFIPMSILLAKVFYDIILPIYSRIEAFMTSPNMKRLLKYQLIVLVIIVLLFFSSVDPIPALRFASWSRYQQDRIYEVMIWLRDNSEENATIVSVSNSQFFFLPIVAYREFNGILFDAYPENAYSYLKERRPGYVIVWNRLHRYNESWYYVDLYRESEYFVEVWSNSEFSIFKVK